MDRRETYAKWLTGAKNPFFARGLVNRYWSYFFHRGIIEEADRIAARSLSFDSALEELAAILHRVALAQAGAAPDPDEADAARVTAMASRLDAGRLQVMYQVALLGRRDLSLAPDEYAGFTMALLRMLSFMQPSSEPRPVSAVSPERKPQPKPSAPSSQGPPVSAKPRAENATPVAPPVAPVPVASAKPGIPFEGDWPAFVERLGLTGMAGMVARHGELASFENNHLELVVPEGYRMYAEKPYQDKLRSELVPHFGDAFRLTVRVGSTAGTSIAAARSRELAKKQASAAEAIEDDPFVRELVRDFGAEVVTSSIRPAEDAVQPDDKRRQS